MKPEKALELVMRYSALTWAIRACASRVAESLEKCTGLDGKRIENRSAWMRNDYSIDPATNDKAVHLREWYRPEMVESDWGPDHKEWNSVGDSERDECIHCFAAHLVVQERKALRKQLGSVKAAMTRTTPKPAILNWTPDHGDLG